MTTHKHFPDAYMYLTAAIEQIEKLTRLHPEALHAFMQFTESAPSWTVSA